MFNALADAQVREVPKVRKMSVRALSDGVSVIDGDNMAGTGYREYADVVVRTMRKESRGFESARRVEKSRFMESLGEAAASDVRIDAASSWVSTGAELSPVLAPSACAAALRSR